MSELPGKADAEGWRRLHPLSPLLRGGIALIVIAGIVVTNLRDRLVDLFFADQLPQDGEMNAVVNEQDMLDYLAAEGLLIVALGGVLVLLLVIVTLSWIGWRFHTYRITEDAVEARSGVLFRSHRRAPLDRIQGVNVQRALLARALGLAKIEVLTAGQDGKVELAYLGYRDAKSLRQQILSRADELRTAKFAPASGSAPAPGSAALPGSEIGAEPGPESGTALSSAPAPAMEKLAARADDFVDADVDPEALAENTLVRVPLPRLIGSILTGGGMVFIILVIIGTVVAGFAFDRPIIFGTIPMVIVGLGILISQFNKGFNFTLSRSHDAVRTGAGLTATNTESIPFGRIHAVQVSQPLLWRLTKWWRVRVTVAGHSVAQGGQNSSQNVVLPVGTEQDALRVIETLLPGIGGPEQPLDSLSDGLSGTALGYLPAGPRSAWVLLFAKKRAGLRIEGSGADATLRIRRGVLNRSLCLMPVVRAQSVQLHRPLMHRCLGLASIQAHTVLGPVQMQMRGIELRQAQRTFDEIAATVLLAQKEESL